MTEQSKGEDLTPTGSSSRAEIDARVAPAVALTVRGPVWCCSQLSEPNYRGGLPARRFSRPSSLPRYGERRVQAASETLKRTRLVQKVFHSINSRILLIPIIALMALIVAGLV